MTGLRRNSHVLPAVLILVRPSGAAAEETCRLEGGVGEEPDRPRPVRPDITWIEGTQRWAGSFLLFSRREC